MKSLFCSLFLTVSLYASVNEGQKIYTTDCQNCHGAAIDLIESKDILEWLDVFDNYYAKFIEAHRDTVPQSWKLDDNYRIRYKLVKEFILFNKGYYEPKPDTTIRRKFHGH